MKIAILEPMPRMCGVTKWTFEAAQGFRDLGHECHVVSFTKSGRRRTTASRRRDGSIGNGWHWWYEAPDVVGKWADARDVLDTYDLIVLNEPKNGTADRDARKNKITPEYITALQQTATPWVTILHAAQYDQKRSPYLAECMQAGNFTGLAIEHQPDSYTSGEWAFAGRITKLMLWPWLPYRQQGKDPDVHRQRIIGIAGRMTTSKGQVTLAGYADQFPEWYKTWLWGAESGGLGSAGSFILYEALATSHGWRGERRDHRDLTLPLNEIGNAANTIRSWPWWLEKDGHWLEFKSVYDDPRKIWSEMAIAVNLTSRSFAAGVEYSVLEAMDAGCSIVMPEFCFERAGREHYYVRTLKNYEQSLSVGKKELRYDRFEKLNPGVGKSLVAAVTDACMEIDNGLWNPQLNRNALDQLHAPRHVANTILEAL